MTLQGVKRKVVSVSDFRFTGRLLGKGNFAKVEEAVHNVLNLKVAVKIIDIREIKEKYVVRNLHREARIMSTLNHPCIAALFQTMQLADNVYYLVTELVSGGDLCSFIIGQRYGKLEERPARVYARQFASALAHMHSFGIVHRDLKMENVILNSTQTQIKIVDFGLSNVWSDENPLRTHCGSPEYAAPELFVAGKEYGPEVDLWSLGIIFYGMVVGQLPFVGGRKNQHSSQERRKRLVAQINKGLGTLQRQAIAPLSPEFRTMLCKLLAADPAKRITAPELAVHPWITEKGRKYVEVHPFKKLEARVQSKLTAQIAELYQTDGATVVSEIAKNPYGKLGGAYNVLAHAHLCDHFTQEHLAPLARSRRTASPEVRETEAARPAPTFEAQNTLYNQCVVLLNRVGGGQQQPEERSKSAAPALMLARNVARMARVEQKSAPPKQNVAKMSSVTISRKAQEGKEATQKTLRKTISTRMSSADNKPSTTSTNKKRPYTTGTASGLPQPLKRGSVSTAVPKRSTQSIRECQRRPSGRPAGMGDAICRPKREQSAAGPQKATRPRDPLANEPIARSIAGYLLKNVPDNLFTLQMARK